MRQEQPHSLRIRSVQPTSAAARRMSDALWTEIQRRYGFAAPNPFDPDVFATERSGFWIAFDGDEPVGSIALAALDERRAELDAMYVVPARRRSGIAGALMAQVEAHARKNGTTQIVLRAGAPQPEALEFYRAAGFTPIERFGRWTDDNTAACFGKAVDKAVPSGG